MPEEFDNCVKKGGRVRTKNLGGGRFIKICFIDGKSFSGEVKKKKVHMMKPNKRRSK